MAVFIIMKFYTSLWLYASIYEVRNIIIANIIASALTMITFVLLGVNMFRTWYFIYVLLLISMTGGVRFFYRFARLYLQERDIFSARRRDASRIMIIGAGEAGNQIAKETRIKSIKL